MHFNSQPHKEADTKPEYSESPEMYFNSQPHKEADNVAAFYHTHTDEFQLTASQGG